MITVRAYQDADARELMTLFYQTVHEINRRDYTPEQIEAWAPQERDDRRWADRLRQNQTFVAEDGGVIVGFGELEGDGHIDRFYCHKDHQGRGVGTSLLTAIEAAARRQGLARLFTEASITARPFFARRGFTVLKEQTVLRRGVTLTNFQMEKALGDGRKF